MNRILIVVLIAAALTGCAYRTCVVRTPYGTYENVSGKVYRSGVCHFFADGKEIWTTQFQAETTSHWLWDRDK